MRRCLPLAIAVCGLAATFAACGSDAGTPPTAHTPTTTGTDRSRPEPVPSDPVLNRHDAPPEGVLRQIQYSGIGDQLCSGTSRPEASFGRLPFYSAQGNRSTYEPEIGEVLVLCMDGFRPDLPVEGMLTLPDGHVLHHTDPAGAASPSRSWRQFLDERWPVGRHVFTARQGSVVRSIAFRVLLPRHRGVRSGQDAVHPGDALQLVIVGQRPRSVVPVDVYRDRPGGPSRYATTFTMRVDERGIGGIVLRLSPRDVGGFLLRPRTVTRRDGQDAIAGITILKAPPPPPAAPHTDQPPATIFQASEQPSPDTPPVVDYFPVDSLAPDCSLGDEVGPHIMWMREQPRAVLGPARDQTAEIGDALALCADDFPATGPLRLTTVAPDGTRSSVRMARPSGTSPTRSVHSQLFLPDAQMGLYRVFVSGGGARVESSFQLGPPHAPGYRIVRDGGRLSILVVGLPPRQTIALRAYRGARARGEPTLGQAEYAGALSAQTDEDGTRRIPLPLDPSDDPAGCYSFRLAYGEHVIPPAPFGVTTVCLPLSRAAR